MEKKPLNNKTILTQRVEDCAACEGKGTLRKVGIIRLCLGCYGNLMRFKRIMVKSGGQIRITGTEVEFVPEVKTDVL